MEAKIRVHGTGQSRVALGIAQAYLRLNPASSIDDLNRAFPETISSATGTNLFILASEQNALDPKIKSKFFEKADEQLTLHDGTKVMMFEAWGKADFARLVEHAKQYHIEVGEIKPTKAFERGGFELEDLTQTQASDDNAAAGAAAAGPITKSQGDTSTGNPTVDGIDYSKNGGDQEKKKRSLWWLWLIVILVIVLIIILLMRRCNKDEAIATEPAQTSVEQADSLAAADATAAQPSQTTAAQSPQLSTAELQEKFHTLDFSKASYGVTESQKPALRQMVTMLKEYGDAKLVIEGHASREGGTEFNQKLSEQRARAMFDFFVSEGIAPERLTTKGYGSSRPIDPNRLEPNRRVEFVVTK